MDEALAAEVELLWEDFHQTVNMTSDEIGASLLGGGTVSAPDAPGLGLSELGTRVVEMMRKRKVDLTGSDVATMRSVVEYVEDRLEKPPPDGAHDEEWRRSLMVVGHDPLKS